jgi:hypothetical protein
MDAKPTCADVQMKLTALKHRVAGMRASDRHRKKGDHRSFVRASSPVRSSPSRPRRFDAAERAGGALSIPEFTAHQVRLLHSFRFLVSASFRTLFSLMHEGRAQMPRLGSMSLHGVDDDNWEDADTQILRRSRLLHSGEEKSASSAKHSHGKAGDDREPFAHDNRSSTGVDVENEPQSKPPVPRPHAGSPGLADGQEVLSTSEGPWSTVAVGSADLSLLNGGVAPPKGGIPSGNSKRDGLLEVRSSPVVHLICSLAPRQEKGAHDGAHDVTRSQASPPSLTMDRRRNTFSTSFFTARWR